MINWSDIEPPITVALITGISFVFLYLFYFFGKMYEFTDGDEKRKRFSPTTNEDYIITGFHFFSLYVVLPLAIFLFWLRLYNEILSFLSILLILFFLDICIFWVVVRFDKKIKKRYVCLKNKIEEIDCLNNILPIVILFELILLVFYIIYALDINLLWIFFQIFGVFFLEQIAQETDLASYYMREISKEFKCIKECCEIIEKHYFFKYLLIPLVSLFEYPSFIFAYKLYRDPISVSDPNLICFFVSIIVVFMGLAFLAILLGKFHAYVLFERTTKF